MMTLVRWVWLHVHNTFCLFTMNKKSVFLSFFGFLDIYMCEEEIPHCKSRRSFMQFIYVYFLYKLYVHVCHPNSGCIINHNNRLVNMLVTRRNGLCNSLLCKVSLYFDLF